MTALKKRDANHHVHADAEGEALADGVEALATGGGSGAGGAKRSSGTGDEMSGADADAGSAFEGAAHARGTRKEQQHEAMLQRTWPQRPTSTITTRCRHRRWEVAVPAQLVLLQC